MRRMGRLMAVWTATLWLVAPLWAQRVTAPVAIDAAGVSPTVSAAVVSPAGVAAPLAVSLAPPSSLALSAIVAPPVLLALPNATVAAPAELAPSLHPFRGRPNRLGERFAELRRAFAAPIAAADEEVQPQAVAQARRLVEVIRSQLAAMREEGGPDPVLDAVERDAEPILARIAQRAAAGTIEPGRPLRYSDADPAVPVQPRPVRIAFYPLAGDPIHWAHVLVGLKAIAELGVDQVVFVPAGDDPRKPDMTPARLRHPVARAALDSFSPFFAYSPVAMGTLDDGETTLFRLLALNRGQRIQAFYMVGDDHYRAVDKKGRPDTLPKLEANMRTLPFDTAHHEVEVAFIEREGRGPAVPTALAVHFLPGASFEASSTQARAGRFALVPYAAYEAARAAGLYGLQKR
ncbi:MAG: hypothetical protein NTX64_13050 [Elusimicrobia bacterium]|nr:hypothetical protein [Elusimicrobiota bacterium]